MNSEKLMELYEKYWDTDEIDVDLANELVDAVPLLISEIEKLKSK